MKYFSIAALMILVASISACGPGQVFGPTITPTPTSTQTPTNTPTPTNTFTPTLTPTTTTTPTPERLYWECGSNLLKTECPTCTRENEPIGIDGNSLPTGQVFDGGVPGEDV